MKMIPFPFLPEASWRILSEQASVRHSLFCWRADNNWMAW